MGKQSPRIENGVIKWYCGDAFYLSFEVLEDETGKPLSLSNNDAIIISFFTKQNVLVKKFEFRGERDCEDLVCHIDESVTKLFNIGTYTYCIKYHQPDIKTVSTVKAVGECEVERCH